MCLWNTSASAWKCQCAQEGRQLWRGSHCQVEVTTQCGSGTSTRKQECSGFGRCSLNATIGDYQCRCFDGRIGTLCQNVDCPTSCGSGYCGPRPAPSNQYRCYCPYAYDLGSATTDCSTLRWECGGLKGAASPDGSSCWCNDTRFRLPDTITETPCVKFLCPGTTGKTSICGPDFAFYQNSIGTVYDESGLKLGGSYVKQCRSTTGTCFCSGPYTTAADGSCATRYHLNRTLSFDLFPQAVSGQALPNMVIRDFTCAPGYSKTSFCHNTSCVNGGVDTSGACVCPVGFSGSRCETDLCFAPFGSRSPVNGPCSCTNSSYWGAYCQLSACANGGVWNLTLRGCSCPQAFDGFNCTRSACGPRGTPNVTSGLCNCSANTHFEAGGGCVPDPPPVCLNGGVAVNYTCQCPLTHYGTLCQTPRCGPNSQINTTTGVCQCTGLWRGFNCSTSSCHPGGEPAAFPSELCLCKSPFTPLPPANTRCVLDCGGNGSYDEQRQACLCDDGYGGDNCQVRLAFRTNQTDFTAPPSSPIDLSNNVTAISGSTPENITSVVGGNCPK